MLDFECDFCSEDYACDACHCCASHCGCAKPAAKKKHTAKCTSCNRFIKADLDPPICIFCQKKPLKK